MSALSSDTAVLIATLEAAETYVRRLASEALSPAAMIRAEQTSTRRALAKVADFSVSKRLEVAPGWSEFVDVSEEIDALLARLAPTEATTHAVDMDFGPLPSVPSLPEDVRQRAQATQQASAAPSYVSYQEEPSSTSQEEWGQPPVYASPSEEQPPYAEPAYAQPQSTEGQTAYQDDYAYDGFSKGYDENYDYGNDNYDYGDSLIAFDSNESATPAPTTYDEDLPSYLSPEGGSVSEEPVSEEPEYIDDAEQEAAWAFNEPEEDVSIDLPAFQNLGATPAETAPEEEPVEDDPSISLALEGLKLPGLDEIDEILAANDDPTVLEPVAPEPEPVARLDLNALEEPPELVEPEVQNEQPIALPSAGPEVPMAPASPAMIQLDLSDFDDQMDETRDLPSTALESLSPEVIAAGASTLTPAQVQALFAQAELASKRDIDYAILLFGDVLDAEPAHYDALIGRGRAAATRGDYALAISDFMKAEAIDADRIELQSAMGELFQNRKDYRNAITYYNNALSIEPDTPAILLKRGSAYMYRKKYDEAIADLERAQTLDPNLPGLSRELKRAKAKAKS